MCENLQEVAFAKLKPKAMRNNWYNMLYNMFFYNMFPKLFTNYKIEFLCDMSYTNHFMNQFCLKRCLLQISFYGCVLTHKTEIPLFTGAALKATSTRHVFEHTQNSTSDCLQEAAGIKNMVSQRLSLFSVSGVILFSV